MKRSAIGLLLLAAIISALSLVSCSRDPNVRKQKYLDSGKRYLGSQQYREAVIQFSNALQVDSRYTEAHYQLAQAYIKMGAYGSANVELRRTLELDPGHANAHLDLGNLLLAGKRLDDAEKHAKIVLDNNPSSAPARALLANISAARGKLNDALQEMRTAIQLDPNNADFHSNLGIFLENSRDMGGAEAAFKKATELAPKSSGPVLLLAELYARQQRWADTERTLQQAVAVEPASPQPRIALARFYVSQGKNDQAEQVLVDAKKAMPDKPGGYRLLADFYLTTGNRDKALAQYAQLLKEHPDDLKLKKVYISVLLDSDRFEEAGRLADEILKRNPKDPDALIINGRVLLSQNKALDAVQSLETALKAEPDSALGHYVLALATDMAGDVSRPEKELREAVRLRPDLVEAQVALGTIAVRKRDWNTVNEVGQAIIQAQPRSAQGYVLRGMAEVNHKQVAAGEADLKQAIQVAPQNPLGYLRLGELKLAQRRYKEADQFFEQALERDVNAIEALQMLVASGAAQKQPLSKLIGRISAQIGKAPNNSAYYALLGAIEAQARDFANAEQHLRKALELDRNNLVAFSTLAQVQIALGSVDKAIATFQTWSQQNPRDVRPYVMLGMMHETRNDWQKAQEMYKKAMEVAPDYPVAANNLAYLMLSHGGNSDVALSLAQTARRGMPDSTNTADTLAFAYIQKGAYASAVDLLQDAIKKAPGNATYEYHLGVAYQKQNQPAKARQHLQRALQLDPKFRDADAARKLLGGLQG